MGTTRDVFHSVIADNIRAAQDGSPQTLLVNTAESYQYFTHLMQACVSDFRDTELREYDLQSVLLPQPFAPLLDLLRELWERCPFEQKTAALANIYGYQRDFLQRYLADGVIHRPEEPLMIPTEIHWEHAQIRESLLTLTIDLLPANQTLCLLIHNIHRAPPSLFEILQRLLDITPAGRIFIVGTFDRRDNSSRLPEWSEEWLAFTEHMENRGRILELYLQPLAPGSYRTVDSSGHAPARTAVIELLRSGQTSLAFFALKEAETYLEQARELADDTLNQELRRELELANGDAYCLSGRYDQALHYYSQLQRSAQANDSIPWLVWAYYRISIVYSQQGKFDDAIHHLQLALKIWENWQDQDMYAKLRVHQLLSVTDEHAAEELISRFSATLQLLQQRGFDNYRSALYSHIPYVVARLHREGLDSALEATRTAIQLTSAAKHLYRLSIAYHSQGLVYQLTQQKYQALESFQTSIDLRTRLGGGLELAKVYNGTGSYCISEEEFVQAHDYFNHALDILKTHRNYQEIALTMFNISLVHILALDYQPALHTLQHMMRLMRTLDIRQIPFHTADEIFTYAGFAAYKSGSISKSFDYFTRIRSGTPHTGTLDSAQNAPLFILWQACITLESNDRSAAAALAFDSLAVAREYNSRSQYLHHLYETCVLLRRAGNAAEADRLLRQGEETADPASNPFYAAVFSSLLYEPEHPPLSAGFTDTVHIDIAELIERAQQDTYLHQLQKKIGEIHFLNSFQELLFHNIGSRDAVYTAMQLVKTSFTADSVYLLRERDSNSPVLMYPEVSTSADPTVHALYAQLSQKNHSLLLRQPDNRLPKQVFSLVFLPILPETSPRGAIVLASGQTGVEFTQDDLRVLTIAAGQIGAALDLQQANELLQQAATVDSLTQVWNRAEIQGRVEREHQRFQRCKKQQPYSLLFLDLDNFKTSNDTFGHHIGDILLREFARLLQSCIRDTDDIGRLGGDEFIILLPDTTAAGAEQTAERILGKLRKADYLVPHIQRASPRAVHIPPGQQLGCSIGISTSTPADTAVSLLTRADAALYQAKQSGKATWRHAGNAGRS